MAHEHDHHNPPRVDLRRTPLERLAVLEDIVLKMETIMALNFAAVQAAVAQLDADVRALLPLVGANSNEPAEQAALDAVTKSLSDLDAAVKAATPAAPAA